MARRAHDIDGFGRLSEVHGPNVPELNTSLWELFHRTVSAHPSREALVSSWQSPRLSHGHESLNEEKLGCIRWSYATLYEQSKQLVDILQSLGYCQGSQMLVILGNSAEWALFFWAAVNAGMTFIAVDPRGMSDLQHKLSFAKPQIVVTQGADTTAALGALPCLGSRFSLRIQCSGEVMDGWVGLWENLLAPSFKKDSTSIRDFREPTVESPCLDTALVIFTSGTTGIPKACPHTQKNLVAQTSIYDPNPDPLAVDSWLVHTPISHIFGINNAIRAWRTGGTVVFPSEAFDLASTTQALAQEKCTVMSATPTLVRTLLAQSNFPAPAELGLDFVTLGGTAISDADIQLCRERLHARTAIQAYGMSEGAPLVSWSRHDPLLIHGYHPGVGKVLPGAAARVCRPGSKELLCRGEVGELHVGGPSVISGYMGGAGSDRFYIDAFGNWLVTGDQARMDEDDVIHIIGRLRDIIVRGGENIQPARIEDVLSRRYGAQIQVVGVPDAVAGQVPVAVVQLPPSVSKEDLARQARSLGPGYALDAIYTFEEVSITQFPRTTTGKVKRGVLRGLVARIREAVVAAESGNMCQESVTSKQEKLVEMLIGVWGRIGGIRPPATERLHSFADSIMLLRYCDAVFSCSGERLYLQDLVAHDTVAKQASLLERRRAQSKASVISRAESPVPSPASSARVYGEELQLLGPSSPLLKLQLQLHKNQSSSSKAKDSQEMAIVETFNDFGPENVIPIRASMLRMVSGQRPQSYNLRVVFRIRNESAVQIRYGLNRALEYHPMLRSILVQTSDGAVGHTVLKPCSSLYAQLVEEYEVDSEEEATRTMEQTSATSYSSAFMFKADLISVKGAKHHYLSFTYNHSVVDALTLIAWHKEVDRCITDSAWQGSEQMSYKLFSDLLVQYDGSQSAQDSVAYHVRRLQGISCQQQSFWPEQRAPGWMIASDRRSELAKARSDIRDKVWNGAWKKLEPEFLFPRRSRVVRLPNLSKLQQRHGITPKILAQSALIIFNFLQTRSRQAIFTTWESGRSWPFVPDWMAKTLPPASSINGPTLQWVLNIFKIMKGEIIASFLKRIAVEAKQAQGHVHAPWDKVVAELKEEGVVAEEASFRQSFVWDVSIGLGTSQQHRDDYKVLEPVGRYDWADCGFVWSAFMVDKEQMCFIASWDTAQLNASEVDDYCDALSGVLSMLDDERSWDKSIEEVFLR